MPILIVICSHQAFLDGSHSCDELLVAPWSAVCVGVVFQRASDKAAGEVKGSPFVCT